jgi:hypothetical protein
LSASPCKNPRYIMTAFFLALSNSLVYHLLVDTTAWVISLQ